MSCSGNALDTCLKLQGPSGISALTTDSYGLKAAAGLVEVDSYLELLNGDSFPVKILSAMADSSQARIRELAAGDPDAPTDLLGRLAIDKDDGVAKAAIFNPNGPYAETVQALAGAGISNEELFALVRKQNNIWKNRPRCGSCGCWVSSETMVCSNSRCELEGQKVDLEASWRGRDAMGDTIDTTRVNPYGRLGYLREGDNATRAALVQMKWEKARKRKLSPAASEASKGMLAEFVAMPGDDPFLAMGDGGVVQFDSQAGVYLFTPGGVDNPLTPIPARSAGEAVRTALRYLEAEGYKFGPIKVPAEMENAKVVGGNDVYVHMSRPKQTGYIDPPPPPPLPEMDLEIPQTSGRVDFQKMLFDATAGTIEFDKSAVISMEKNVAPLMTNGWGDDQAARTAVLDAMKASLPAAQELVAEFAFSNAWKNSESYEGAGGPGWTVDSPEFDKAAEYFAQAKSEFVKEEARMKAASAALGSEAMGFGRSFKVGDVTAVYTSEHFRTTVATSELNALLDATPSLRDEDWLKDAVTFTPPTNGTSMRYKVETPTCSMEGQRIEAVAAEYVDARRRKEQWESRMSVLKSAMSEPVMQQGKSHKAANGLNVVFSQGKKERRSWKPTVLAQKFAADPSLAEKHPSIYQTFGDTRVNAYTSIHLS